MSHRAVPAVREGIGIGKKFSWVSDGIDVAALLRAEFDVVAAGEPTGRGFRIRTPFG